METSYDAVFIGAGHNALVAAAELSRAGWSVLLVERGDRPGGFVRTDELTLPGFKHDTYAGWHPLFTAGPAYVALRDELDAHGLRYAWSQYGSCVSVANGGTAVLTGRLEDDRVEAERLERGDSARLEAVFAEFARFMPAVMELVSTDPSSARGSDLFAKLVADPAFLTAAMRSERELLDDLGPRSSELRSLIAHFMLHLGRGPDDPGGALWVPLVLALSKGGFPTPVGGSGELARALAEAVLDHGGDIVTETQVTHIAVADGVARGVVTSNGEVISARRAIVASVTPDQLYLRLLDDTVVPSEIREEARRYRFGRGVVQVHLALAEPPHFADERLEHAGQIVLGSGLDAIARALVDAANGLLPAKPSISFDIPSNVDPTRAPPRQATVRLQILEVPMQPHGDAAGEITGVDGRWTTDVAERFADRVIAIADRHAPGLAAAVIGRAVVTSATLAAANPNAGPGDPYADAYDLLQGYRRPLASQPGYRTHIPQLWMTGAATWPGAGVSGNSGHAIAQELMSP
jgi:phytoene dehydrogenase-like protein